MLSSAISRCKSAAMFTKSYLKRPRFSPSNWRGLRRHAVTAALLRTTRELIDVFRWRRHFGVHQPANVKACTLLRTEARFDRASCPLEADEIRLTDTKCEAALATACQAREASCDVRANFSKTQKERSRPPMWPSLCPAMAVRPTALGRAGSHGAASLFCSRLSLLCRSGLLRQMC